MPAAFTETLLRLPVIPRSLRIAWLVGGIVILLHWYLLGGFAHTLQLGETQAPSESTRSLHTRLITVTPATPPPPDPAPPPTTIPSPPPPDLPATDPAVSVPAAPAAEGPVTESTAASEAQVVSTTTDLTPAANAITQAVSPAPAEEPMQAPVAEAVPRPERLPRFAFPPPVVLRYDVFGQTDGQRNVVSASLTWKHDAESYQTSLVVTKFLIPLRQWTSKGALTASGLAPVRFGEKGLRRAEVASHFVREEGRVIFSANTAPAPLLLGAQDHVSVFVQLASLWAGEPNRLTAGDSLSFQSIGPRQAETWTFVVSPEERITVPGGSMQAIKLTREATGEYSTKAEIWLAPQLAYLPAHIRLSEANGNVLDMVWTDSQLPQ